MTKEDIWRLLDLEYDNPYMNLSVEEAIPRKVGEGVAPNTIRLWRNPNTVVIGYFQSAMLEVNFEACKKFGTNVVRRFTGGGAVYHDYGNLNYAISLHRNHSLVRSDILETFKALASGVIKGLNTLGISVRHEPINSLQVNGWKIGGAAGSIKWEALFYHGSILVNSNLNLLSKVLNTSEEKRESKYVHSVRKNVSTLSIELQRDVSILEVKEALTKGFEKTFAIKLVKGELTDEEKDLTQKLFEEKYSTDEWNFGR